MRLLRMLSLLVLGWSALAHAGPAYELKFATLAPQGSTWMNILEDWSKEVATKSEGRLVFKFYPGGVAGDEPDVLRKIRFGQLHGGAFTGYGIGYIYSPARVLEIPFLFRDIDEVDYVRGRFMPEIESGFRANGYELVGWMEVGFVHFFSREPIRSLDDLRKRRIWLWQGDPLGRAFFDASNISPVPLSITDVFTSLSTGLIDTVYSTPLAAIAMQWFTKTDYITSVPMANASGALVVSEKFFGRLPPELQALLRDTGRETGIKLIAQTRVDNEKSMSVLMEHGLQPTMKPGDIPEAELIDLRDRAARTLMDDDYIPARVFERTRTLLDTYRKERAGLSHNGAAAP